MRGKLVLLVGIGIGYVLGARAGRERYEDIKRTAGQLWNDPCVRKQRHNVEQFAKDKAPEVVDFLGDTAKKVIQRKPAASAPAAAPRSAVSAQTGGTAKKKSTNTKAPTTGKSAPSTSTSKSTSSTSSSKKK